MREGTPRKHSHYFKRCPYTEIDVYRVLKMFEVSDPCLQHAIKKLLCAGGRGVKAAPRDVQEAIDTLTRWLEMWDEDEDAAEAALLDDLGQPEEEPAAATPEPGEPSVLEQYRTLCAEMSDDPPDELIGRLDALWYALSDEEQRGFLSGGKAPHVESASGVEYVLLDESGRREGCHYSPGYYRVEGLAPGLPEYWLIKSYEEGKIAAWGLSLWGDNGEPPAIGGDPGWGYRLLGVDPHELTARTLLEPEYPEPRVLTWIPDRDRTGEGPPEAAGLPTPPAPPEEPQEDDAAPYHDEFNANGDHVWSLANVGSAKHNPEHPAALAGWGVWMECCNCSAWRRVTDADRDSAAVSEALEADDGQA